ncbi:MAG: hypothetical protein SPI35_05900 [Porphyromonas sp.]|nr:hypothetical protein [Porphyromonas sp.]
MEEKKNPIHTLSASAALSWAREISKLPDGCFKVAFFKYSRRKGEGSRTLRVFEGCKIRPQLPSDVFSEDSENYFLFYDNKGNPRMCYRILIRYMGFPHDGYKLHKIKWV